MRSVLLHQLPGPHRTHTRRRDRSRNPVAPRLVLATRKCVSLARYRPDDAPCPSSSTSGRSLSDSRGQPAGLPKRSITSCANATIHWPSCGVIAPVRPRSTCAFGSLLYFRPSSGSLARQLTASKSRTLRSMFRALAACRRPPNRLSIAVSRKLPSTSGDALNASTSRQRSRRTSPDRRYSSQRQEGTERLEDRDVEDSSTSSRLGSLRNF